MSCIEAMREFRGTSDGGGVHVSAAAWTPPVEAVSMSLENTSIDPPPHSSSRSAAAIPDLGTAPAVRCPANFSISDVSATMWDLRAALPLDPIILITDDHAINPNEELRPQ
jgi:hypothetical protein